MEVLRSCLIWGMCCFNWFLQRVNTQQQTCIYWRLRSRNILIQVSSCPIIIFTTCLKALWFAYYFVYVFVGFPWFFAFPKLTWDSDFTLNDMNMWMFRLYRFPVSCHELCIPTCCVFSSMSSAVFWKCPNPHDVHPKCFQSALLPWGSYFCRFLSSNAFAGWWMVLVGGWMKNSPPLPASNKYLRFGMHISHYIYNEIIWGTTLN